MGACVDEDDELGLWNPGNLAPARRDDLAGLAARNDQVPDWVGTVTIDGTEYGMAFFAIGTGKPFAADPSTSVHFFEEIWTVYASLDYEFDADGVLTTFTPGAVVLAGPDSGITNMVNSKYHMTGEVAEASGAFATLVGRPVFMSGVIDWYPSGAPQYAPGELRIH